MQCLTENRAIAYVDNELPEDEADAVDQHLENCESCRALVDDFTNIRQGIGAEPGEFDDPALTVEIMTLVDMGRGQRSQLPKMSNGKAALKWLPLAAAAAVIPFLVVFSGILSSNEETRPSMSGVVPRGEALSDDAFVSLEIFRKADRDGQAVYLPVSDTLASTASLAIAFEDRSRAPFSYLMVFAVDQDGDSHWYYPAHPDPKGNPQSIRIDDAGGRATLPDEISHELSDGPHIFVGLFSKTPLNVREVEAKVKQEMTRVGGPSRLKRFDIDETGQWLRWISVTDRRE